MRITVLGATGGTGGHLLCQALEAGHHVTAVDRNGRGGISLERTGLAHAILAALPDPATAGHTIALGY